MMIPLYPKESEPQSSSRFVFVYGLTSAGFILEGFILEKVRIVRTTLEQLAQCRICLVLDILHSGQTVPYLFIGRNPTVISNVKISPLRKTSTETTVPGSVSVITWIRCKGLLISVSPHRRTMSPL